MNTETESPPGEATQLTDLEHVKRVLLKSGNCAQTSFTVLNEAFCLEGDQILKALTPMPGIALRGETCGAVVGSLMALGLVYGRDDLSDWGGYVRSLPPTRRFCRQFEEENGSTACSAILLQKLGRNYDLADKFQAIEYASAGGPDACSEVVAGAISIASELIAKKKPMA